MERYKVKTRHKISRRYNAYLDKTGDIGGYKYWFLSEGIGGICMKFDTEILAHWVDEFGIQRLRSDVGWNYDEAWVIKLED